MLVAVFPCNVCTTLKGADGVVYLVEFGRNSRAKVAEDGNIAAKGQALCANGGL